MKYALAGYTLTDTVRETQSAILLRGTRQADRARVVVKLLRADHPTGAQLARLRHEHALLSSLDLPSVVRTFGLVQHGRGEALVLEDLGDRSVESLFRERRPSLAEFLDVAIEMAGALAALHSRAIIHKDIKPHHFLVQDGGLKIIDLGIATRLSSETQAVTSTNLLEGTLAYMSPEQTGRMNRSLDRRTDLYSLGAALYHLLTGRLPFEASDPLELVHAHIARAPRPAHDLVPEVPPIVSEILAKLLAKAAEDRYQSAAGVRADLEACRAQLAGGGSLTPFPLGRQDGSGELSVPQKLYGRAAELATLRASFDSASRGGCRLLVISGYSGIGKSALVNEIRKHLGKGGTFVAGKFDQVNRSVPFAALAAACRGLVRSILAESPQVLHQYASRLREAVGRNGKLMAEMAPEIELVIGPQPPVTPLGPAESQARFELVFRQFLQVFADEEHPLALFLDDLQWADAASLRLVRQLMTGGQCSHVLVIGAYRNNETSELHPLLLTIDELRKAGVAIDEIILKSLGLDAVTTLLAETLRLEPTKVAPFAEILLRKTNGNPFFLQQFLAALAEQQILRFDTTTRQWTWDSARIEAAVAADNVVDLLIARVRRLPVTARRVLTLAACVGQEFDLGTLSLIWQGPTAELTSGLWEALREGLLVPLDASYRYLAESAKTTNDLGEAIHSRYRFLHDRVQQHAYELVDADERSEIHLRIGRLLLAGPEGEPGDDTLFEVVRQMNLGEALITGEAERRHVARLNLRAGLRTASSGAHAAALTLVRRCVELIGPNAWEVEHQTTHRAHLAIAECEFMSGNVPGALQTLDTIEARSQTVLERVAGREIRIVILASNVTGMLDAVACGVETARMLGAELPSDDAGIGPAIGAELGALRALLADRSVESFLDLPVMADPQKRALVDVMFKTNAPAFMAKPDLSVLLGLKAVRLAIEHGNAPMSPYFYDNYGIINYATGGELDVSFRFGKVGIDLLERPGYAAIEASTHFLFGAFNAHWRRPISVSQEHLRHSVKAGLESGAYLHTAWAALVGMYYRLYRGESIPEILADIPQTTDLLRRSENPAAQTLLKILEQTLKALSGATSSPTSLDGDGFDEAGLLEAAKKIRIMWVYYHVLKIPLVFHAGDFKRTLELADAALPLTPGMFFITEHALYRSLARAALAADQTGEARQEALATLRQEEETFRKWAEACPANHAHRLALVSAEIAGLGGDAEQAMDLYDRAVRLAREGGFTYHEAEANELAAKYHLRKQRTAVARAYLQEAWYGYQQWGAKTKTRQLAETYPTLLAGIGQPAAIRASELSNQGTTHSSTTDVARGLDLVTAVRATQALAGELELGKLLERLMRVIVENAGAQRGILVLNHEGRLEVEALVTVETNEVRLGLREPIERTAQLAASVVQYVSRSKEALVLPDAAADPRFARDPYIARQRPRSVLCLAMQHQGRLVGVLYLENNAATNAFSVDRVDLLQFVAAQAAVAVENATLYGELRAATTQLQHANDTLEAQVAERTEELRKTLAELWSEMDLARKIQTVLLPSETRFRDYEVSAMMVPASTVGGDYYDIIRTDGSDWVLIGDVSGHGVTAGLTMMMVQTAIRTVVLGGGADTHQLTPAQVLSKVNSAVRGNLRKVDEDHYMTITGLQLDGNSVRYAGLHQDILIYRAASRAVERVETRGMWIGPVDDIAPLLRDDTLELASGDIVLLFTDGITEAMIGGRRLGTDGLAAVFHKLAENGSDNGGILRGIMQTMEGAPQDDVTMMAVRYLPAQAA